MGDEAEYGAGEGGGVQESDGCQRSAFSFFPFSFHCEFRLRLLLSSPPRFPFLHVPFRHLFHALLLFPPRLPKVPTDAPPPSRLADRQANLRRCKEEAPALVPPRSGARQPRRARGPDCAGEVESEERGKQVWYVVISLRPLSFLLPFARGAQY